MKKFIAASIISFIFCFVLLSCQKEAANTNSSNGIKVYLTDHQTPIFDSVFIDIQKLEVKLEDDTLSNGGWIELSIHAGVYNILRFRNGLDTLFATGNLANNRIHKLRLTLGSQNSVLKNGQSFALTIKDNDHQVVLNLTPANFDIATGQIFLWLDFDAGNSIKVDNSGPGNNNGFELKPHIKAFGKTNTGRIEGTVLPLAADPIVKAIIGSDTATAIPERRNGEFKIIGLNPGVYKVLIDGQNNYKDTLINNVTVTTGKETKLPVITLHQ